MDFVRMIEQRQNELQHHQAEIKRLESEIQALKIVSRMSADTSDRLEDVYDTLYDFLNAVMQENRLSQRDLATLMGFSDNAISMWKNQSFPSLQSRSRIANSIQELTNVKYDCKSIMKAMVTWEERHNQRKEEE